VNPYRQQVRKGLYNLAHRVQKWLPAEVREWMAKHPRVLGPHGVYVGEPMPDRIKRLYAQAVTRGLRAERLRAKSHTAKAKTGVLYGHRKGQRQRVAMPITVYRRTVRRGRGLTMLPEVSKVEAMLLSEWPRFRRMTDEKIATLLPVEMTADTIKKIRQRLGLYRPAE
jgi:hypothetical protein